MVRYRAASGRPSRVVAAELASRRHGGLGIRLALLDPVAAVGGSRWAGDSCRLGLNAIGSGMAQSAERIKKASLSSGIPGRPGRPLAGAGRQRWRAGKCRRHVRARAGGKSAPAERRRAADSQRRAGARRRPAPAADGGSRVESEAGIEPRAMRRPAPEIRSANRPFPLY